MAKQGDNAIFLLVGGGAALAWLLLAAGSTKKGQEIIQDVKDLIPVPKGPTDFIKRYYKDAKQSELATGVPALLTLAQAGLESAWGKSGPGNNFFGVKAGKNWTGETQKLKTWECGKTGDPVKDGIKDDIIAIYPPGDPKGICGITDIGEVPNIYDSPVTTEMYRSKYSDYSIGVFIPGYECPPGHTCPASIGAGKMYSYRVYGKFRKYASAAEGFRDHGSFLKNNSRYAKAFNYKNDPKQFAREIAKAGYATAPNYATVLVDSIDKVNKILQA